MLYANERVTFTQAGSKTATIDALVRITEASPMIQRYPMAAGYLWCIRFDAELAYPTGPLIGEGDTITWPKLLVAGHQAVLKSLIRGTYLGVARGFFAEIK